MYDVCGCIETSSNFSLKANCKVQPLNRVDKLLATSANLRAMLVLCSMEAKLKRQLFCLFSFAPYINNGKTYRDEKK